MEKTKLLTITVIGLLLLNFGTLGFLFFTGTNEHRPPHGGRPEPKAIIIERLHFDAIQQKEYIKLIQWHRGEIEKLDGNIREAKNELYSHLSQTETNVNSKDSLIAAINSYQKQVEETHFKHFEDIKKLCRKDQLEDYTDLTEDFSRIFAPKPKGRRHD
jgi:hypothetical protein